MTGPTWEYDVAIDDDGDAVFVWIPRGSEPAQWRVHARALSRKGRLRPIRPISAGSGNASHPRVTVDADGDAVIAWTRRNRIEARTRSAAGELGVVENISPGGQSAVLRHLGMGAAGDAVIVWNSFVDGSVRARVRELSADGALEPTQTLGRPDCCWNPGDGFSAAAVDAGGDAVIVWLSATLRELNLRVRSAAGGLGPVQVVSTDEYVNFPQVAVNTRGDAVIVWRAQDTWLKARTRSASGALSPIVVIETFGNAPIPSVAIGPNGDALFAWTRLEEEVHHAKARTLSAAGVLGPIQDVHHSTPFGDFDDFSPQVAFSPDGTAVIAWWIQSYVTGRGQILARIGP
jgi:hypothetical protein